MTGEQTGQKGVPSQRNHDAHVSRSDQRGTVLPKQGCSQVGSARAPCHQSRATAKLEAKPSGVVRPSVRKVACSKAVTQFPVKVWSAAG